MTLPETQTQSAFTIHPAAHIGGVHYTTADLEKQVHFYHDVLGFELLRQEEGVAALGAGGNELLRLTEVPGAQRSRRTTGLYHTAFLVPTRWGLAHLVRQLIETRTPVEGTSDHGTHLAIYLPDAEGNGIELAWDFPKERWPMKDGKVSFENMPNRGVDLPELLAALDEDPKPWNGLEPGSKVGHVHLHVADLHASQHFYHDLLGFEVIMNSARFGALFVSAGGYHHHIGANIWRGVGAPPPPENAIGLRYFTIALPDEGERQRLVQRLQEAGIAIQSTPEGILLHDPARNGVMLTIA